MEIAAKPIALVVEKVNQKARVVFDLVGELAFLAGMFLKNGRRGNPEHPVYL